MRNELIEIEECCRGIVDNTSELLTWTWDDYIGAALATFKIDQAQEVALVLDGHFASQWNHRAVRNAPRSVQRIAQMIGGIWQMQNLLVTTPEQSVMAYGAWWPWGDGETISVRIGLVLRNVPDHEARQLQEEFIGWFISDQSDASLETPSISRHN